MAGLVYSAYHGCLQERHPISHSSCFDVCYRGLPVPRTDPVCAAFELADCGKDQHLPAALLLPSRSSHLMSVGVCNLVTTWKIFLWQLCRLSPGKLDITQQDLEGQQTVQEGAASSPPHTPHFRSVLICFSNMLTGLVVSKSEKRKKKKVTGNILKKNAHAF